MNGAPGTPRQRGSRKRTGCFGCRGRHIKCDETKPVCKNCSKRGLQCRFPALIVPSSWSWRRSSTSATSQPGASASARTDFSGSPHDETSAATVLGHQNSSEVVNEYLVVDANGLGEVTISKPAANATSSIDVNLTPEIMQLLQTYKNGIGIWMDLFDHGGTYQRDLLRLVPTSALLLHSVCALAAQQLSIIKATSHWTKVAETHYGQSLHILRMTLSQSKPPPEVTLATSVLLASYELLALPGEDYVRHFQGTRSLIESFSAHKAPSGLLLASFWVYVRHDVSTALCNEVPTMFNPDLWPALDLSQDFGEGSEDLLGNEMLRLVAKVLCLVHGDNKQRKKKNRSFLRSWNAINSEIDRWYDHRTAGFNAITCDGSGSESAVRYWFASDATAIAIQTYHVAKMLLALNRPQERTQSSHLDIDQLSPNVQDHANAVIDIALSGLSDGALVHATQALVPAARHASSYMRVHQAIELLQDIGLRTGFHTQNKIKTLQECKSYTA